MLRLVGFLQTRNQAPNPRSSDYENSREEMEMVLKLSVEDKENRVDGENP